MEKDSKNTERQEKDCPTSERKCEIEGKRFVVTRHFCGDGSLNALMNEIASRMADRESGL